MNKVMSCMKIIYVGMIINMLMTVANRIILG